MNMKAARAREWLADPYFTEIFAEFEAGAVSTAIYARVGENEKRVEALTEARVIRALLSKLKALADEGEANSESDAQPA